jgi:hypothetical protein
MPRVCTICGHPKRNEIDQALVASGPLRRIADQYLVSKTSLIRHKVHVSKIIGDARKAREIERGENLVEQAHSLHARALGILERAEAVGHLETALRAIREVRGILELLGKKGQNEPVRVIRSMTDLTIEELEMLLAEAEMLGPREPLATEKIVQLPPPAARS